MYGTISLLDELAKLTKISSISLKIKSTEKESTTVIFQHPVFADADEYNDHVALLRNAHVVQLLPNNGLFGLYPQTV